MSNKLKAAVAALALCAAGAANAAIDPGAAISGSTADSGELVLSIWDATAQTSYNRDLGVSFGDFLADPAAAMSFAADSTLTTYLAGTANPLVWNVVGANSIYSGDYSSWGVLTTSGDGLAAVSTAQYGAIPTAQTSVKGYAEWVNPLNGTSDYAENVSGTAVLTDGGAYAGAGSFGNNFGGAISFSNAAQTDSSMAFYQLGIDLTTGGSKITEFAGTWTLAANGDLSYSAVPVPAAVWLLGSALVGMVGVARRRDEDAVEA